MNNSVLLGMSGGVDSSVAAMILLEKGYKVTGITFLFTDNHEESNRIVDDAKSISFGLGFDHIVVNYKEEFDKIVVDYFIQEYKSGRTPFPCAVCNPLVKFKLLKQHADELGCNYISTGHYVRVDYYNSKKFIYKGNDSEKDQSFFLWGLNEELIKRLVFPLGDLNKSEIRKLAKSKGFINLSKKKDSLGVCFVEGSNYRKFLETKGVFSTGGNFVDERGEILGIHKGITNYTIGQRRGLGINMNKPLFVSELRTDTNEVVLSDYDKLFKVKLILSRCYITHLQILETNKVFTVKIRYRLQNTPCRIKIISKNQIEVNLLEPLSMIANGQTAVFYDGDRLVGGGFIEHSE